MFGFENLLSEDILRETSSIRGYLGEKKTSGRSNTRGLSILGDTKNDIQK